MAAKMDAKQKAIDKAYVNFYNVNTAKKLPKDATARKHVEDCLRDGFVVIPNAFTEQEAIEAKNEIDRLHGNSPHVGRNIFEGYQTNRILALPAKSRVFDKFCLIPAVQELNKYFLDPAYQLSTVSSIVIHPGEKAQILHHDDGATRLPRPRPPVSIGTMIVLDDYTELNGATRIIPGSHEWGDDRHGKDEEAIPCVCPRGSVIYFIGTVWHSGGGNRTDKPRYAITVQYCQPWMRPFESWFQSVDPRRVLNGEIPAKIADMMGYKSYAPFYGTADGLNPRKGAQRLVRWMSSEKIETDLPGFHHEEGEKETHHRKDSKL